MGTKSVASTAAWRQSEHELLTTIEHVKAGKSLKPTQWPNGARVAVAFSLDVDNQTALLSSSADSTSISPLDMSIAEYGARQGIQRLTKIFDKYNVPATYFMPAISLKAAPEMADVIENSGAHEVALHGWVHEKAENVEADEMRELLIRSSEYLESVFGPKPVGFRAPAVIADHTFPVLQELSLLYDSSLASDDVPFEIIMSGKPSGLIELPPSFNLEDGQLDTMLNGYSNGYSPSDVLQIFEDEFDVAYEEGTMVLIVLHPHITGRRSRATIIEKLIQHMQLKGGVWFATHKQIAEFVTE